MGRGDHPIGFGSNARPRQNPRIRTRRIALCAALESRKIHHGEIKVVPSLLEFLRSAGHFLIYFRNYLDYPP